jgi:hypothetical protein
MESLCADPRVSLLFKRVSYPLSPVRLWRGSFMDEEKLLRRSEMIRARSALEPGETHPMKQRNELLAGENIAEFLNSLTAAANISGIMALKAKLASELDQQVFSAFHRNDGTAGLLANSKFG